MQTLTAPPRAGFTDAQIRALLTAPDLHVTYGCELLDASLFLVEDLTADCSAVTVHHINAAEVHGTVDLTISRELAWGRDRIRPHMTLSSATTGVNECRWNLGVFVLTTPNTVLGEYPQSYSVTGFDQLHLIQGDIGDSVMVAAGANVLDAVRSVLTAAGVLAPILLDTAGSDKTLVTAMVWPLTSSESPTWIKVVNDLLAAIGYRALWCDADGAFRSGPYVLPELRASEWTLTVGDLVTGIVAEERTVTNDVWGVPNWMRFIADRDAPPVEGDGRYTRTNPTNGPSSIASVGRIVRAPVVYLDAVSQADLVVQGDRLFGTATRSSEVITVKLSPFPALWHVDRMMYNDPALGAARQVQAQSWDLPLDGTDGTCTLETVA